MSKRSGTMTRAEIGVEIAKRANAYIAQGVEPEIAVTRAGVEFRRERREQADDDLAYVKQRLGISD